MAQYAEACLGVVAPYYNLVLVVIVIILFVYLFRQKNKNVFLTPWKFLFFAVLTYVIEEIANILDSIGVLPVSPLVFPLLELLIIGLFIHTLLTEKEYLDRYKRKK